MNKYIILSVGIVIVIVAIIAYSQRTTVQNSSVNNDVAPTIMSTPSSLEQTGNESATITPMQEEVTELIIEDLVAGTGAEAVAGKKITVNYKGTLTDETQFDSSYDRGQPFSFVLGVGSVIQGWDQGFARMKVGGKRKLTIPPSLGYGAQATGAIPANSVLIFEVELLKVE
jgi:FKBP-type peptidyl-prolyl cis-trans isomerase